MQIDSQQSLIQVKRERFRVQIRKEQLDQLLTKKRIVVPHQGNEMLNEKLQKVRNQMIAITENMENEFTQAMNKYYDYLVEYDLMNDILHEFRVNYHPEGRIQIYWILSNLTLGDGISTKLLFDTSFDFLNVIYYDLKYQEYVFFGLEIIQNFLADRDIDVVEALLTDDSLLKVLNTQMIPEEKYNQIVTHLCHNIVQFKLFLSEYTVETICLAMPTRIAFQWTYILAKGMESQNNHLILHTLKYLLQNNDDYNFILIKILEQVMEQELLKQIFQQKEIKYSIAQLFLNTHNPDIQNSILLIYEIVSSDDDLAQLICQTEVLDKAIELSLEQYTCVNALKFLDTWMGDFEFLFDYPKLIDEQFYCQQINNLNFEFPAESIQILKYIESILQYGDSRNDESYRLLLCKYKIQIENLAYSQNDVLEKLAEQILQCYVTD